MPNFTVSSSEYTVAEYCAKLDRKELKVNSNYQRGPDVWPLGARAFLIESVLLGFPIPKFSIRSNTDLKTRETVNEIVDGQQRSRAIYDFYHGKFAIGRKSEILDARGCSYEELPAELQQAFLSYRLQVDVFVGASTDEIRELFRRINSYTVSLNHEEKRHARYQGEMKWFIYDLCRIASTSFEALDVFTEKQLARMQDTKFMADVVFALLHGIQTTKPADLDKLYSDYDDAFQPAADVRMRIEGALTMLNASPELADGALRKPHNFYTLLLAIMHVHKPVPAFVEYWSVGKARLKARDEMIDSVSRLAEILDLDESEVPKKWRKLWKAAAEKTNTWDHRRVRFVELCSAVAQV